MKLISLARSKKEREKNSIKTTKIDSPSYSYGTRLRFEKEDLKKLGLKLDGVNVGDVYSIEAIAEVCSVSQNQSSDYSSASIELQVTKIALEKEDSLKSAIDKAIEDAD